MAFNRLESICIQLEFIRPNLNKIGLDLLEHFGQTIFQEVDGSGSMTGACFFLGKTGSDKADPTLWSKVTIPDGN